MIMSPRSFWDHGFFETDGKCGPLPQLLPDTADNLREFTDSQSPLGAPDEGVPGIPLRYHTITFQLEQLIVCFHCFWSFKKG